MTKSSSEGYDRLRWYQKEAITFIQSSDTKPRDSGGICIGVGTGKSACGMIAAYGRTLFITRLSVLSEFQKIEAPKWLTPQNASRTAIAHGGTPESRADIFADQRLDMVFTTLGTLRAHCTEKREVGNKNGKPQMKGFVELPTFGKKGTIPSYLTEGWDTIVLDEAQDICSRDSQSFDSMQGVCRLPYVLGSKKHRKSNYRPNRILLTATPVMNSAADLYTLLKLLDPDNPEFKYYWPFVEKYHQTITDNWGKKIGRLVDPEGLNALFQRYFYWKPRAELVPDLPPVTRIPILLQMEPKQEKAYEEMRKSFYMQWNNKAVSADTPISQLTRLQQICVDPDMAVHRQGTPKEEITPLKGPKADAALEKIAAAMAEGIKVTVFSTYTLALKKFAKRLDALGIGYLELYGETPQGQRATAKERFWDDPNYDYPVFLLATYAGGVALNLQNADMSIHLVGGWNPVTTEVQPDGRLDRIGGTGNPKFVYDLLMEDTVEEHKADVREDKKDIIAAVVEGKAPAGVTRATMKELLVGDGFE